MECKKCKNIVENENYCPKCGYPLTKTAIEIENKKVNNIRLETLLRVCELTDHEETLLAIKDLILNINKKEG